MNLTEENINNIVNPSNIAKNVNEAVKKLNNDITKIKETTAPITWSKLAISTMNELINNLWELKDACEIFLKKNKNIQPQTAATANNIISYYETVRRKLNRLKTEIYNYNRRFPNNQIKNIEELVNSKIKSSMRTSLKEEILKACKT